MGDHLLPTDTPWYADDIRTDTMGVLSITEMGRSLGKMADTLSHGAFLWSNAILRGIISLRNLLIISVVVLRNTSA